MNKVTFRREGMWTILITFLLFLLGIHIVTRDNGTNVGSIYYGAVPGFNLEQPDDSSFTLLDLRGETWVINYVNKIQSTESSLMANQIHKFVQDWGYKQDINFLTIANQSDNKDLLSFTKQNKISEKRWNIISGSHQDVSNLIQNGFHISLDSIKEPNRFILVDNNGQIRGYYTASNQKDIIRLVNDVHGLIRIS